MDNIAPIDAETTNEHFWEDVVPFIACCKAEFLNNCEQYYEFRPSDNCSRTRPPPPGELLCIYMYMQPWMCNVVSHGKTLIFVVHYYRIPLF